MVIAWLADPHPAPSLSATTHLIGSLLTPLKLSADDLLQQHQPSRQRRVLRETSDITEIIATGLKHFSLVSSLQHREIKPHLGELDLYLLISRLIPIKQARWPHLHFELSGPPTVILSDRLLLDHAISELIDNSARAGARKIHLLLTRCYSGWSLTVRDDGQGPLAGEIIKLTQAYYCAKGHPQRFGLGLYVVDQIAESLKLELAIGLSADRHLWIRFKGQDATN